MGAVESVPETSIHEFTVKVRRSPPPEIKFLFRWSCLRFKILCRWFWTNKKNWGFFFCRSRIATARKWAWRPTRGRSSSLSTSPPNGIISSPWQLIELFFFWVVSWFGRCWNGGCSWCRQWVHGDQLHAADGALSEVQGQRSELCLLLFLTNLCAYSWSELWTFVDVGLYKWFKKGSSWNWICGTLMLVWIVAVVFYLKWNNKRRPPETECITSLERFYIVWLTALIPKVSFSSGHTWDCLQILCSWLVHDSFNFIELAYQIGVAIFWFMECYCSKCI